MSAERVDITAIRMHLNELKASFDKAIRDGEIFVNLKKIYMGIKELECHLKVLEWDADNKRLHTGYLGEIHRQIENQKPLL
jgi:hypothetical protein